MKIYDLNELEDLLVSLLAGTDALLKRNVFTVKAETAKEALEYVLQNDPEIENYADFMGTLLDEYVDEQKPN